MSEANGFLARVVDHLREYAQLGGVSEDEVYVRLTLADGSSVILQGLQLSQAKGDHRWGMIR